MEGITPYENFEISVTSAASKLYAAVLWSPAGDCSPIEVTLPFDPQYAAEKVELAVLRSVKSMRSGGTLEADLRAIGEGIFKALLVNPSEIKDLYSESRAIVRNKKAKLRLKLRVDSDALSRLPFEYFYDPIVVRDYLGLHAQTSLVRYMSLDQPPRPLVVDGPLRVLAMVASPKSDEFPELRVQEELARIDNAVKGLHQKGQISFEYVRGQTYNDLVDALTRQRQQWHVFHFIGHGDVGQGIDDEGFIVLSSETGGADRITGTQLKRLMALNESLRLVILNCCNGAGNGLSVAKTLVKGGMPAVLAMQYPITDNAAIELATGFYFALTNGEPVDGAVTAARIRMQPRARTEWGTPILYMRSPDGQIFSRSPLAPAAEAAVPAAALAAPAAPAIARQADAIVIAPAAAVAKASHVDFGELEDRVSEREAISGNALLAGNDVAGFDTEALSDAIVWGERLRKARPNPHIDTRLAAAHFELAKRFQQENINKAFVNLTAAIQLNPQESEYVYTRANIYARNQQYPLALADIDKAISLSQTNGEFHWARGVIRLLESRAGATEVALADAIKSFNMAIDCNATVAKYYSSRGAAHQRQGKIPQAREDLDRAIVLDPADGKTWFNRGHVRIAQEDAAGAADDFRTAVNLGYALAARELQPDGAAETRH